MISNLIKTTKIENIITRSAIDPEKVLQFISQEKDAFGIVSSPFLIKAIQTNTSQIKNINFIVIPNYNYIFFITNKNLQISSLDQLNNKKVNIGPMNYDSNIFGNDLLRNIDYQYIDSVSLFLISALYKLYLNYDFQWKLDAMVYWEG